MKPRIPMGGFFAAAYHNSSRIESMENRLKSSGAATITLRDKGIVMGAWKEYEGQGVWTNGDSIIAYDLDLINEIDLWKSIALNETSFQGDTGKLIWSLYQKYGINFIDRLRGAFAFTIYDKNNNNLIVVTDFYGVRPVLFSDDKDGFVAASRIRHLLIDPTIKTEIDPEAIYHYLFFQAICSPLTIYKSIRKLEPGKGLRLKGNKLIPFTHYDIRYKPENQHKESHWVREIPDQIEKATKRCADACGSEKTGCFLSGGTDSSSVVGYYTKITGMPAKTFSIGFDDPKYNELDFARIAVRHFGTEQHEYIVTPDDVFRLINELPAIYDEPFGNASVVPAYYCAKAAGDAGLDILLGGDGGDEIFGGNERYVTNLVFEKYFMLPKFFRRNIMEPVINHLPNATFMHKVKSYVRRANLRNPHRFFSYNLLAEMDARDIFKAEFLSSFNPDCFLNIAGDHYDCASPAHDTDRLLYVDMKFTITDNDLRKVTQMVESAGLQVRYPLLDRDLVDFTTTIPPTLKVKWKKNRYIFKKSMEGFLPKEIINKSKHGMGMPIARWLRENTDLSGLLSDNLFSGEPKINQYVRQSFLDKMHESMKTDGTSYYGDSLWVFLILELWLRKHA